MYTILKIESKAISKQMIHIISESRSGSSSYKKHLEDKYGLYTGPHNIYRDGEDYPPSEFCKKLEYNEESILKLVHKINKSKRMMVIKNHYSQLLRMKNSKNDSTYDAIMNINADKQVLMRRNKLDQSLSMAYSETTGNWAGGPDAMAGGRDMIHISDKTFDQAMTDVFWNFKKIYNWAITEKCKIVWFEDVVHSLPDFEVSLPKNQTIKNLNELVMRFHYNMKGDL